MNCTYGTSKCPTRGATRRRIVTAGGGTLAGIALSSCGAGNSSSEQAGAAKPAGPVTIQYLGRGSAGEEEIYRTLIKDFSARNPTITVDVNWAGTGGADLIAEKLTALLAGGTPPDTTWAHSALTLDWADQKALVDLTQFTKEKGFDLSAFYKGPVDDFRWESQLLALPRETSSLVMFYNKQMFAENGVKELTADSTWAEWLDAARKLTKDGPNGKIYGTFASGGNFNLFQMIWQNGAEIMNEQRTESLLDRPPAIEAAQFIVDMRLKHQVSPFPSEFAGSTQGAFMISGRMATNTTNQSFALDLQKANQFQWDAVAPPKNKVKAYAQASSGHGIVRGSKQQGASWELVKWLAGEEASKLYAAKGLVIPAYIKVTEADSFSGAGMPANYGKTWRDVLRQARSFSVTRRWNDVRATFDKEFAPALDGTKSATDAMRAAKTAIDQILQRR
jgi:multiple sugar transport system substrate-binding protein